MKTIQYTCIAIENLVDTNHTVINRHLAIVTVGFSGYTVWTSHFNHFQVEKNEREKQVREEERRWVQAGWLALSGENTVGSTPWEYASSHRPTALRICRQGQVGQVDGYRDVYTGTVICR
jgi:hypothetical protein